MSISLKPKLWQISVAGLGAAALSPDERELLRNAPPAGIILFARNVTGAGQLRELISELRSIVPGLLVMADHEGGRISVLADAAGVPPSAFAMGNVNGRSIRRETYAETARRLKYFGIDSFLGPVADINTEVENPVIGTRSFGGRAVRVGELVSEAVAEFRKKGVLTCLKHFPGHGCTKEDSHLLLPEVPALSSEPGREALIPFAEGIRAGAEMVMAGHLRVRGRTFPASLDPDLIGDLRARTGFDGVVITDALEMKGVRGGAEAVSESDSTAARAVEAGNDILLFSDPLLQAYPSLGQELAGAQDIPPEREARIGRLAEHSIARINVLKEAAGAADSRVRDISSFSNAPYRRAAESSLTIKGDPGSVHPPFSCRFLGEKDDFALRPVQLFAGAILGGLRMPEAEYFSEVHSCDSFLRKNLKQSSIPGPVLELECTPDERDCTSLIFVLNRKVPERDQFRAVCELPGVIILTGIPPGEAALPGNRTFIITGGAYPAAARAITNLLLR